MASRAQQRCPGARACEAMGAGAGVAPRGPLRGRLAAGATTGCASARLPGAAARAQGSGAAAGEAAPGPAAAAPPPAHSVRQRPPSGSPSHEPLAFALSVSPDCSHGCAAPTRHQRTALQRDTARGAMRRRCLTARLHAGRGQPRRTALGASRHASPILTSPLDDLCKEPAPSNLHTLHRPPKHAICKRRSRTGCESSARRADSCDQLPPSAAAAAAAAAPATAPLRDAAASGGACGGASACGGCGERVRPALRGSGAAGPPGAWRAPAPAAGPPHRIWRSTAARRAARSASRLVTRASGCGLPAALHKGSGTARRASIRIKHLYAILLQTGARHRVSSLCSALA